MFYKDTFGLTGETKMIKHPYLPKEIKSDEMSQFEKFILFDNELFRPDLPFYYNETFNYMYYSFFGFKSSIEAYYIHEIQKLGFKFGEYSKFYSEPFYDEQYKHPTSRNMIGKFSLYHDYEDVSNICNFYQKISDKIARWNLFYPIYNSNQTKEQVKKMEDETTQRILKGMGW